MAVVTTYGSASGNMRVKIEHEVSGDPATGQVTVNASFYACSVAYGFNDAQTMTLSNALTEAIDFQMVSGYGATVETLVAQRSWVVATAYGSTGTSTVRAALSGVVTGGTPFCEVAVTIPARPHLAPRAVPAVSNTYVKDTQVTVGWTPDYDPTSGAQPVLGHLVSRWDNVGNSWAQVASVSWDTTAWTDTSTTADRIYQYRVIAYNEIGSSPDWTYAATQVLTTPATSGTPTATLTGGNIVVSWADNAHSDSTWDWQRAENGTTVASTNDVAVGDAGLTAAKSATHTSPTSTVTHAYRVRPRNADSTGAWSAWSNVVQLVAAPAAPTNLAEVPDPVDAATTAVTLSWVHNPVDSSAQTALQVVGREVGTSPWAIDTTKVAWAGSSYALGTPTIANGKTYEWKVRTWGAHADPSPYSAVSTFVTSAVPTVTITGPATPLSTSTATLAWTYADSDSHAQAGYRAWLRLGGVGGTILEQATVAGTAGTHAFTTHLADGAAYTLQVQVRDTTGQWSAVASLAVTVGYAPPPTPTIGTVVFDVTTGAAAVPYATGAAGAGEEAPVTVTIEQSTDAGATWETVAAGLAVTGTVTAYTPLVGGVTSYRAVAYSALPSTATSNEATLDTTSAAVHGSWCYLTGPAGTAIRFRSNPAVSGSTGRSKTLHRFAGRTSPVEYAGVGVEAARSARFDLYAGDTSTDLADIETFVRDQLAPVCYRDPDGGAAGPVRRFVSLGQLSYAYQAGGLTSVTIPMVEVDRD